MRLSALPAYSARPFVRHYNPLSSAPALHLQSTNEIGKNDWHAKIWPGNEKSGEHLDTTHGAARLAELACYAGRRREDPS
jgi:hypothetical protein